MALNSAPAEVRRLQLQTMRRRATGLLLVMTAVFVVSVRAGHADGGVWEWVQAGSEAAMVGGLADWFAVVALFRHPMGLPIPHTAVIVERKDAFGTALGEFVQENFVVPEMVAERVGAAQPAERLAAWLCDPANAATAAGHGANLLVSVTDVLDDEDAHAVLGEGFDRAVRAMPLAPMAGRALRALSSGERNRQLIDALLKGAERVLEDNRAFLRGRFEESAPWWLPGKTDRRLFDKMYDSACQMVADVRTDPDHELRHRINAYINGLGHDIERSPDIAERVDQLKTELLANPDLRAWLQPLWADLKETLGHQAADPDSELRARLAKAIGQAGAKLAEDRALAARLDQIAVRAATTVTERFAGELPAFVGATIARWDPAETAGKLELLLGRDLQFIRINGTLVGGLAGLLIHGLGEAIG